jgi:hypothetical protein
LEITRFRSTVDTNKKEKKQKAKSKKQKAKSKKQKIVHTIGVLFF